MVTKTTQRGFTIIELLIVIVVIGILAAIVLIAYNGVTARANDSKRAADLDSVSKALELYHIDNGGYPVCSGTGAYVAGNAAQAGGLSGCVTDELVPKYMSSIPTDPVNSGSKVYWYGVGFQKKGPTTFAGDTSDNYIIGDKQDAVTSPVYSGWGRTDLTLLLGSSN